MFRPRIHIRSVMILIALLAMGLGWAVESAHRRERFQELTMDYALAALISREWRPEETCLYVRHYKIDGKYLYMHYKPDGTLPPEIVRRVRESFHWSEQDEARVQRSEVIANYYTRLADKYAFASTHPWLPVLPDFSIPRNIVNCRSPAYPESKLPEMKPQTNSFPIFQKTSSLD